MSVTDDDLRAIWQQGSTDVPSDRSACLTEVEWARLMAKEVNEEERVRAADHIGSCTECAEEYRFLLPLQSWASEVQQAFPRDKKAERGDSTSWRRWFAVPRWGTAGAAVVLLAVGAVGAWLALREPSTPKRATGQVSPPPVSQPAAMPQPQPLPTPPVEEAPAPTESVTTSQASRRTADDARSRMSRAKTAARQAGSAATGSAAYVAALAAEREGQRLYQAGNLAEATSKFSEANGLFRSAELTPAPPVQRAETQPPPSTAPVPSAPPTSPAGENAAIEQVLRDYVAAYNSKNIEAIRRIYTLPDADAISLDKMFREARDYKMTVDVQGINVSGDTATVTGVRRVQFRSSFGIQDSGPRTTQFTLEKRGSGWLIVSVR